jgi:membrane protein implicated in regulation of membrane protease activity
MGCRARLTPVGLVAMVVVVAGIVALLVGSGGVQLAGLIALVLAVAFVAAHEQQRHREKSSPARGSETRT